MGVISGLATWLQDSRLLICLTPGNIIGLLGLTTLLYSLHVLGRRNRSDKKNEHTKRDSYGNTRAKVLAGQRPAGEWTPVEFTYPFVTPVQHKLADIKPMPYRPFRWGEYNVTMGIRNMPFDEWIELDNLFPSYHEIKAHRFRTKGQDVVRVLPDTMGGVAAIELVHELAGYLSQRYPKDFTVKRDPKTSAILDITLVSLGVTYTLPRPSYTRPGPDDEEVLPSLKDATRAMEIAGQLVQDDLAIMLEGADGRYYFHAGSICLAGFWRMKDKMGLALDEIHNTADVPKYREKLEMSMERFFRRLPVDKPVIRNNYFVQVVQPIDSARRNGTLEDRLDPEELSWSTTTNGLEDEFTHGLPVHPSEVPVVTADTLRLRTERQTLRRLPHTGAIVFTIRTYVVPVTELAKEGLAGRFASAVRSWPEDVQRYKGKALYGDILIRYLESEAEKQEEVEKNNASYPF